MKRKTLSQRAFTLIELLVVISIIAILASLAFPAVNGALDSAKRAKVKNDVIQIVTAIKAYQTEYGRLPFWKTEDDWYDDTDNNNLFDILRGHTSGAQNNLNPRMISFIEIRPAKGNKDGIGADGKFYDPWGSAYLIKLDLDYDNQIQYYDTWISGSAIAVSKGKNKNQQNPASTTDGGSKVDDIVSYQ